MMVLKSGRSLFPNWGIKPKDNNHHTNKMASPSTSYNIPVPSNPSQLKPCSYYISGTVRISGPIKPSGSHLTSLSLLIVSEWMFKTTLSVHLGSILIDDLCNTFKTQVTSVKGLDITDRFYSMTVNIRKFINIDIFPISQPHLIKKPACQVIDVLNDKEDRIVFDYNLILSTGDNTVQMLDSLRKSGYIKKRGGNIKEISALAQIQSVFPKMHSYDINIIAASGSIKAKVISGTKTTKLPAIKLFK